MYSNRCVLENTCSRRVEYSLLNFLFKYKAQTQVTLLLRLLRLIHPYIHTYIHISIHTSIRTFIHSYIHTSIHISIHPSIHPPISNPTSPPLYRASSFYPSTTTHYPAALAHTPTPTHLTNSYHCYHDTTTTTFNNT